MSKRIPLDMNQFKVELPSQPRDPLDSLIPTTPPPDDLTERVPFKDAHIVQEKRRRSSTPGLQKSSSPGVQQSRTPVVQKSITAEGGSFSDYPLVSYQAMKKLDAYLTWEQVDYLESLEKHINRGRPERERDNPEFKRITKNSIIRVLVELARRFQITVDPHLFRNERDLIEALDRALKQGYTERKKVT